MREWRRGMRHMMLSASSMSDKALYLRRKIVDICIACGGHVASSLSCIDILCALYYGNVLNVDAMRHEIDNRDKFILSKGHAETALFVVLADLGFFPGKWLSDHYRQGDCYLGGHPDHKIPGVEISSGALGHGLSLACGMAKAAQLSNRMNHYFVLMGDAECTEGAVWEAALFAAKHQLNNLTAIIDFNNIGSIDFVENFTSLAPFDNKWRAFNWDVMMCDGHNIEELVKVLSLTKKSHKKPTVVLANTVKGKGVSFIENEPFWHVKRLTKKEEISQARKELEDASM